MSDEEPDNRLMMIKTVEKLTARIEELEAELNKVLNKVPPTGPYKGPYKEDKP